MTGSRRRTLMAGVALILMTNAVALGGAAYNRSGQPEAVLSLTQRELQLPYAWGGKGENSELALGLQWRTLGMESDNLDNLSMPYLSIGGAPDWLDKTKLAALGFDVSLPEDTDAGRRHYDKLLSREVLLVLEMNGPAYRRALERTREHSVREQALPGAHRGGKEFEQRAQRASEQLKREEQDNSRLFVIDAGVDAAALRRQYPDNQHYAIVRGQIRPQLNTRQKQTRLSGYISDLSSSHINVPLDYHGIFGLAGSERSDNVRYVVSVAFGKRLEPWITAATDK